MRLTHAGGISKTLQYSTFIISILSMLFFYLSQSTLKNSKVDPFSDSLKLTHSLVLSYLPLLWSSLSVDRSQRILEWLSPIVSENSLNETTESERVLSISHALS